MKKKKKTSMTGFPLTKAASDFRLEFARNAKDPSLILKESCDQTKLEVLKTHPELGEWLLVRIKKWIKIFHKSKEKWVKPLDIKHSIYADLAEITIPRSVEDRQWVWYLEAYLKTAMVGFFNNFLRKEYKDEDVFEQEKNIESFGEENPYKTYTEFVLSSSLNPRQMEIALSIGEDGDREQIADELGISTKTVYRDLKKIGEDNKEFCNALAKRVRGEAFYGKSENVDSQRSGKQDVIIRNLKPRIKNQKVKTLLREPQKCPRCKRMFLGLFKIKQCRDHKGLEEV